MGSGSSKEEKKPERARDVKKEKPVANVNNQSTSSNNNTVSSEKQHAQNTFITQPDASIEERNKNNSFNNFGREQASWDEEPNNEVRSRKRTAQDSFVWQADQDTQDELNEVLQIPTDSKYRSATTIRQEDLPETYAQRKQREQYTLNQQTLLRQKTIIRNPDDWKNEEEEEGYNKGSSGFDPSKFRSVNHGQVTATVSMKSTVFTVNSRQDDGVQFMPGRQTMDEFDVSPRQENITRELPHYNASEQDLMASLERDLL